MDNSTPAEAAPDILWPGKPYPLGAAYDGAGTNFALFSSVAERVYLCLFDESGAERRVELTLGPGASWVPEYYPTHSVESDVTGLRVVLPVGSRDWLVSLLLRLGEDVVIVSDGEAVTEAAERAWEALRAYGREEP